MADQASSILFVDDEADDIRSAVTGAVASEAVNVKIVHPDAVTEKQILGANLVMVDYKLDKWTQPVPAHAVGSHIPNGVALATVLRQRVKDAERPIAFAIHTAVPEELAKPLVFNDHRSHILARLNNLDWVFPKAAGQNEQTTYGPCQELARAVCALPDAWPIDDPERSRTQAQSLLALDPAAPWSDNAWDDVVRSRPPLDELTQPAHGLLFLRWLLQKALPYPAFLLDEYYFAAKLSASVSSVRAALAGRLGEMASGFRYNGILATFLGKRWWRAGLGVLLQDVAQGEFLAPDEVRDVLISKHSVPLEPLPQLQPVVCLDRHYRPMQELGSAEDCVRILPDEWPHYADIPWARPEEVATSHLRNIVIEPDRQL